MGKRVFEEDPASIKYHVKKFLLNRKKELTGKVVIDFPSGNGITSRILRDIGATPFPFDLFPGFFQVEGLECRRADIRTGIPVGDAFADALICQEGIEHFSDQYQAFREFNRVLKPGGMLLITTPSYSNIRSRLSYLLMESERYNRHMPPNELDSIWMARPGVSDEIYFGHIFLTGIQKLRVLTKLAGFRIRKVHFVHLKFSGLIFFPFLYPFILLSNYIAFRKNLRKHKDKDLQKAKKVYREIFALAVNPKILLDGMLMVEFEKELSCGEVSMYLRGREAGLTVT
ncbi:MAG: class I SAM-dependent methyltransferase [bacterium]